MLAIAGVEEDSVLLLRGEGDGDVGLRPDVKWLHLHVGGVVQEAQACQVLASFACKNNNIWNLLINYT